MFANRPPLGLFQIHTFGGAYSDELAIFSSIEGRHRGRSPVLRCDGPSPGEVAV